MHKAGGENSFEFLQSLICHSAFTLSLLFYLELYLLLYIIMLQKSRRQQVDTLKLESLDKGTGAKNHQSPYQSSFYFQFTKQHPGIGR